MNLREDWWRCPYCQRTRSKGHAPQCEAKPLETKDRPPSQRAGMKPQGADYLARRYG